MKVFVVDIAKCNGCYGCQIACKDEHVDNDWMPYAKPPAKHRSILGEGEGKRPWASSQSKNRIYSLAMYALR